MKARRTDKDDAEEAEALAWMEAEQQKAKAEQAIRQQQDRERAERAAAERAASERDAQQKAHYEAEQQRIREQQLREVEIQRARDLQNKLGNLTLTPTFTLATGQFLNFFFLLDLKLLAPSPPFLSSSLC